MLDDTTDERDPQPGLFDDLVALLDAIAAGAWRSAYPRWELALLGRLGFGLDLSACAATGLVEDLIYVSPKSGRAVSAGAGAPYRSRLLPLPAFLREGGLADAGAAAGALRTTGFFLEREVFAPRNRPEPAARIRLVDRLSRESDRLARIGDPE